MKKVAFLVILVISLFIIKNFITSIYNLWQKQDLIVQAKSDLETEKKKNQELKNKLSLVKSPQFIEEEARNKLFLGKPGENQVVLSQEVWRATDSSKNKSSENSPNWQKWLSLFFD